MWTYRTYLGDRIRTPPYCIRETLNTAKFSPRTVTRCHSATDLGDVRTPTALTRGDVRYVASDPERRLLLSVLAELETPEHLSAIVRNLATHTNRSGSEAIRKLRYRLHHVHLPVLESTGLVDYSAYDRTVELTDAGRHLCAELARVG